MAPVLTEEQFGETFKEDLGDFFERALALFRDFGPVLSYDVFNVLLHAKDQKRVEEILGLLDEHQKSVLSLQHPDVRGRVHGSLGVNKTQVFFVELCEKTLGLEPSTA
ncbi:MAG: hypothetical protein KJI69_01480 [Patescibacteria group bacterium]|nr:hypothetical protein [Patescibacteria group bacterium]